MRRSGGSVPAPADPAVLSLNLVHRDDIPIPMPDGAAPLFAWTLQSAGAMFDPPVQIEFPNVSGLQPGSIVYFLSFNHDTHCFEIVAGGYVTDDGASIVSDPGVGIRVAGYCPPCSVTGDVGFCPTTGNRGGA